MPLLRTGLDACRMHWACGRAAFSTMVCDRSMLVVDFGLATIIPFIVQWTIWRYVYREGGADAVGGFGYAQLIFYYAFALSFSRLNNGYDVIASLSALVHEGTLDGHVVKPYPFPLQKLSGFFGESALYLIPIAVVFGAQLHQSGVPAGAGTPVYLGAWTLFILLGQLLCFLLSFCIGLLAFWVVRASMLISIFTTMAALLSGVLLPPELWPEALRPVMSWNPFRFMAAAPAELIVKPDMSRLLDCAGAATIYCIALSALARVLWKAGLRRYHSAGG